MKFSLFALLLSLSSCAINKRANIIVPGEYIGIPKKTKSLLVF